MCGNRHTGVIPERSFPEFRFNAKGGIVDFPPMCTYILCYTDTNTNNSPT